MPTHQMTDWRAQWSASHLPGAQLSQPLFPRFSLRTERPGSSGKTLLLLQPFPVLAVLFFHSLSVSALGISRSWRPCWSPSPLPENRNLLPLFTKQSQNPTPLTALPSRSTSLTPACHCFYVLCHCRFQLLVPVIFVTPFFPGSMRIWHSIEHLAMLNSVPLGAFNSLVP